MNLLFLLLFGSILFLSFGLYLNPRNVEGGSLVQKESKMIIFPILFILFFIYIIISAFQYIDLSPAAKWINSNNNDLSRYKMGFDSFGELSLKEALFSSGSEPLYTLTIFVLRKITNHFSLVLLIFYSFIFSVIYRYLKVLAEESLIFYISFFVLVYTEFIISYCLLRMGLAVALVMLAYVQLMKNKYRFAFFYVVLACGFHISAAFAFIVIVLYKFSENHTLKILMFFMLSMLAMAFLFSKFLSVIINAIFPTKFVYLEGGIAKSTYLTNFLFLLFLLSHSMGFYADKKTRLIFCILLSSFYILPLQIVVSIFYRMIFYTYPGIAYICCLIWKTYRSKKHFFVNISVRSFIVFYLFFFLYKFVTTAWFSYGLDRFKLFYIN